MERNDDTTSLSFAQSSAQRGGGGKLRKPLSRKPPATPYARPQQRSRWLSKIVDPAYRLISGGATRILPSLFSIYRSPQNSLTAPSDEQEDDEDHEFLDTEGEDRAEVNAGFKHGESRSPEAAGPISKADRSRNGSDLDGQKPTKRVDVINNDGLSEIEQLLKDRSFSRDEIYRLIDIIRSRAVDHPEQENRYPTMTVNGDAKRLISSLENPRKSIEEKQEILCRTPWGNSNTPLQSSVSMMQDKVAASPIDIAKAYMGTKTSEAGLCSKSLLPKDERTSPNDNEFDLKPYIPLPSPSPSPKPSTCWPGAMLQEQRDYLTPQSERGRYGLHNFPRTPYSRSIFSKSKSKLTQLQGDGNRAFMTSTPLQQSQTPIYGQSRRYALDNGHRSVGPIRRLRHKAATESPAKGSVNFLSSVNGLSPNSNFLEGYVPAVKKNLEVGGTSGSSIFQSSNRKPPTSEVGFPSIHLHSSSPVGNSNFFEGYPPAVKKNLELGGTSGSPVFQSVDRKPPVHPHSSQMARTILEHLDRNLPTPKDKSAELNLATSWKKPQSSNVTTSLPIEQNTFLNLGGRESGKKGGEGDKKNSAQLNEAGVMDPSQENTKASKLGVNETTSGSEKGGCAGSHDSRKNQDFEIMGIKEIDSRAVPNVADVKMQNMEKPPSHSLGNKPVLPSISVGKPGQERPFSSDSSSGFSFQVSASTGVFSEPPTPSIMPSLPASDVHQPKEGFAFPSYSFGLSRPTSSRLVFAFPSTSSAPTNDNTSELKFNFGSDKRARLSFNSFEKEATCY